jgi:ubiquinone/menaquinone biosynthesis C-methylase UbiE
MTWTDGYISDVGYPAFFYKEMQPAWLATVARFQGFAGPEVSQPFTLCELGCGVGINLLVAAACHREARFVGVDFNEAHVHHAREAANASGIDNVEFVHADFSAFARDNDRTFDFVTSHGVWSWIAPEHQAVLLACAARSLKPGGLFYLHYMCHPGSTDLIPLQHVLNLVAHHMPGPSEHKAQTGLMLLQQLAKDGLFQDRPSMAQHLANIAQRDPADLAHEFLADNWQPQHCVDVHQQAGEAGLTFLGSADVFNNLDASLSIPGKLQRLIGQTRVPALAETLKDMARNAHQRTDLFQKGPIALEPDAVRAGFEETRFRLLPGAPQRGPIVFATPIGPITGPEAVFDPLLQRLAAGQASGAELSRLPAFAGNLPRLLQALQLLMMQEIAHPETPVPCEDRALKLSQWFVSKAIALTVIPECATAVRRA